jgi:hypothetical protein
VEFSPFPLSSFPTANTSLFSETERQAQEAWINKTGRDRQGSTIIVVSFSRRIYSLI